MIASCTIRAPRDGIVVYANQANPWSGRSDVAIKEGATVRQGQPIFNLPDPTRMRVQAKVNESKVSLIRPGMKARITVDAFPDRPFSGTVNAVTAIPAPANGPISDVKIYYAMVEIDNGGYEGLRPGMTAEVTFLLDIKRQVTRIPLQAVRRVGEAAFAAVPDRSGYQWRPLELGAVSSSFAEVRSGLQPGDKVVANPEDLPAPEGSEPVRTAARAELQGDGIE
jgi:multidrug efflux pump subunit AcrA (membrane-fusion protein)